MIPRARSYGRSNGPGSFLLSRPLLIFEREIAILYTIYRLRLYKGLVHVIST